MSYKCHKNCIDKIKRINSSVNTKATLVWKSDQGESLVSLCVPFSTFERSIHLFDPFIDSTKEEFKRMWEFKIDTLVIW